MRRSPAQFNFNVNVSPVGAMEIGGSGGPGIVGIARGGGVGFSATAVSPSPAEIKFTQGQANAVINQQWAQIERTLEQLITELRRSTLTQEKAAGSTGASPVPLFSARPLSSGQRQLYRDPSGPAPTRFFRNASKAVR